MYSTRDEPGASLAADKKSYILPPNVAESPLKKQDNSEDNEEAQGILENLEEEADIEVDDFLGDSEDNDDVQTDEPESDEDERSVTDMHPDAPVIYPRMRFSGHCNVETVKDGECFQSSSIYAQWVIGGDLQ